MAKDEFFDHKWYVAQYPDVVQSGIDPLEHYLKIGKPLGRKPYNPERESAGGSKAPSPRVVIGAGLSCRIDVIIPVYNALEDVKRCLDALFKHTDGLEMNVIVVNDDSDVPTTDWLRSFCQAQVNCQLLENASNQGYTKTVNTGLRAAKGEYLITLNSDTIVTSGWLVGLLECMNSASQTGIVGPLSNAASWQNVPKLLAEEGGFAVNALPAGMSADEMAQLVRRKSQRIFPMVPFVNGFCFMISRDVIDAIGYMDEENFPVGYGEENDYCIRAANAGFALAIADNAYVYHAKSKSFGHDKRKELSTQGTAKLKEKHGKETLSRLTASIKNTAGMDHMRGQIEQALERIEDGAGSRSMLDMALLFVLPVKGGGGGAHSVMQEVAAMRRMGVQARVAIRKKDFKHYIDNYPGMADMAEMLLPFESLDDLKANAVYHDVVIATVYSTASTVRDLIDAFPHLKGAYYVQDYEPLFFSPGDHERHVAGESYEILNDCLLFAKTDWIRHMVQERHAVDVQKVEPSLDHDVYHPRPNQIDNKLRLCAMIRPRTPRRGAKRTLQVLAALSDRFAGKLEIHLFGCEAEDPIFQTLDRPVFEHVSHGSLTREGVAAVLASSDLFLDLSDYQAFGRTGLEAMACGCVAVVPQAGGADEYAKDGDNALVVDTLDVKGCIEKIASFLETPQRLHKMQRKGLQTAARYSPHRAALSELMVLDRYLNASSDASASMREETSRPRLVLVPLRRKDASFTGSAHVRLLRPYLSPAVTRQYEVSIAAPGTLPAATEGDIAIVQRDALLKMAPSTWHDWLTTWRQAGNRLLLDIDDDLLDVNGLYERGVRDDLDGLTNHMRELLGEADRVLVSTPTLKEVFADLASDVQVVPNRIDKRLWQPSLPLVSRDPGRPLRIGYMGTPTHDRDLTIVQAALRDIQQNHGTAIEIEVIGAFENVDPLFGKRVPLPKDNEYPAFVDWVKSRSEWDIAIIPLIDDRFNRAKSNLKFLESAALGAAIICSNVPTFTNIARHGDNALVAENTTEAWHAAIEQLIADPELRHRLAQTAHDEVMGQHVVQNAGQSYLAALAVEGADTAERAVKMNQAGER